MAAITSRRLWGYAILVVAAIAVIGYAAPYAWAAEEGGGEGAPTSKSMLQFLAAGGLANVAAADIHHYPRLRPPEFIEPVLAELGRLMEEHGSRKPIWRLGKMLSKQQCW